MDIDTDSDESSDDQRLCQKCSAINGEALMSADGYRHALSRSMLADTVSSCDLCNLLSQFIDPGSISQFNSHSFKNYQNLRLGARPIDPTNPHLGNVLTATIDTDTAGTVTNSIRDVEVWTSLGDPAAKYGVPVMNIDLTNTKSPETFRFILSCLDECSKHNCVSPLRLKSSESFPSRLLNLGANSVCLVDVETACPPYIALSHCWGTNLLKCMTKTANLPQMKANIDWHDLTPTFRDAVEITRRLGVRYIWIDALCIVQDSREDWANESIKMGDIYHNAFLTISASHARDGSGGCFNKQSSVGLGETTITITTNDHSTGLKSSIMLSSTFQFHPPRVVEDSPINSRGWVYQERILSPRIVHFTATQLIWECRKAYRLEDLRPLASSTIPSMVLRPEILDTAMLVERWHTDIVSTYCKREFTKYEDRLVALAGIAQVYQLHIRDQYLAGLWTSHLPYGLSWTHRKRHNRQGLEGHRYPSWTWASHNGEITWQPFSTFSPDTGFSILANHLEFELAARKEFSPVKGGFIAVMGRVAQVTQVGCQLTSVFDEVDFRMGHIKGKFFADDTARIQEISSRLPDVLALALGHIPQFGSSKGTLLLVLAPAGGGRTGFVRLGHGIATFSTPEEFERFWDGRKPEKVCLY
ncbi:heterokaryon incompatibility protein-domain-containing protein [Dactylonectria macrodidyma]|uniref:Heterokaryon incompatibility protein-domain-containing protein n=1 Tax=Dactylonectria macrodidyma TaxID=307937 RepID=A0A9P9FUB4_9HYPO|nr:heterokaryon incompatibility protein-domain-containing protein [Dactylonectria macrodidyma]